MRSRLLLLLAAAVVLVALPAGPASAGWVIGGTGTAGARAAVLMPPTGLTVAGQSCTPTASPGVVTSTIAHRDSSSATGLGTVTVARPAGTVDGDVLLAFYVVQSGTLPAAPTGWVSPGAISHPTTGSLSIAIYTRQADVTDPGSWTWTSGATDRSAAVTITAYSGVNGASPLHAGDGFPSNGTLLTTPSLTPTVASTHLIGAFTVRASTTLSEPTGMTARSTVATGTGTAAVTLAVTDQPHAPAAATGTRTSTAATGGDSIAALLALNPKVTTVTPTISYVDGAAATGTSSVAVTSPAGVQAGDLLLVGFAKRATATLTITTPAGWTRLRSEDAGASDYRQTVFWRLATPADLGGTTYTFASSTTDNAAAVLLAYRGVDQLNPLLAHSGQSVTGDAILAPSITPGRTDARLIGIFGTHGTGTESTPPAGMTRRQWSGISAGKAAEQVGVTLFDQAWPSDAATGSRTATTSKGPNAVGQLLALKAHSLPTVSLAWAPSTSSYAEGYDFALTSGGSPVASSVLTPATSATYDAGTLTPGGSYRVAVTTRAQGWRSTTAELDFTVTTQC